MIEFVIIVLSVSLFLYAFLAGADFGAGILELFPNGMNRQERSYFIGKAMGPVWEANHIWLILALVIMFNAFPHVFWFFSDFFHFPLGALVMGIIFRGASFTFMHYDPIVDRSQKIYHWIFGLSSIWCTMWLGVIIGSLMLGDFTLQDSDIYSRYFKHWLNPFALTMGLFISTLMCFNASLFLYIDATENSHLWKRITLRILFIMIFSGLITHLAFFLQAPERWKIFFFNPYSLVFIVVSFLLLFPQYFIIMNGYRFISRAVAGLQLLLIMAAGFVPLFPKIILFRDQTFIDLYQAAAEPEVIRALVYALSFGCLLILPGYFYLMRIFKTSSPNS